MSGWAQQTVSSLLVDASPGFASGEDLDEGIFQVRMNNVTSEGALDLKKRRRVTLKGKRNGDLLLKPGDVLFNSTNSPELVGKSALFPKISEPATFSNHFVRLRPIEGKLDGSFLSRWLHLQFQRGVFRGLCKQWVNQATVGRDLLLALEFPLPPLPEQRRIAAILDQADALKAKRREALAQLDRLTQSIFIEMFGDPIINPRGWPRKALADIGKVITGNTPPRERADYFGNHIEWIKSDNINAPSYYLTQATEGLSESGKRVGRTAPPFSILVTCIAGSPDCIGNSAMADREVAFNQQINAFVPELIEPHFAYVQMIVGKRLIQEASTNGMKGMVSKSRFEKIALIVPPLALQQTFATRIQAVESLKATHRASLAESDALFASLQHRAFAGQLS